MCIYTVIMDTEPDLLDMTFCTCANLRKAARVVTQIYDAALQPTGLKATQFTVVAALKSQGAIPVSRLADILVIDRTTLTRNLRPLEREGFVRVVHDTDQRIRNVELTESGHEIIELGRPHWEKAQRLIHDRIGQERWLSLQANLEDTVTAVNSG